ncbi:MAG TPA: DUF1232 domain-containing protein [Armatimonadota bacterium]|nr:DUF1232 domain-containing protein [Armatimonadota bacterium]
MKTQVKELARRSRPTDVFRFVLHLPNFVRLFLGLLGDRRVSGWAKLLFLGGIIYAVSPLDFIPDLMPLVGELDDLTVFILSCRMFVQACPIHVVDEHVARIDQTGRWAPFGR